MIKIDKKKIVENFMLKMKLRMESRIYFTAILIVVLLVLKVDARFVHQLSDTDIPEPVAVQQCRLGCLAKV